MFILNFVLLFQIVTPVSRLLTSSRFSTEQKHFINKYDSLLLTLSSLLGCRQLAQRWTLVLFVGTCLLYCTRMAMPISAVTMAATFQWSKIDSGLVLGGFFWGYCFTQILGGHVSDKYVQTRGTDPNGMVPVLLG